MARQSYFELADQLFEGHLERQLGQWRTEGKSFDDIALELRVKGITITGEAVRGWCISLGIHKANQVGTFAAPSKRGVA